MVYGDGEYGSCSVDAYMGIVQAFALPPCHCSAPGRWHSDLPLRKAERDPHEPLPVTSGVTQMAMTGSHFALLCRDGSLWCCEAQAFADKIRWRGSSEYYTRPWGPWQRLFTDATRMTVTGEEIRIWRHDTHYSYMEPTLSRIHSPDRNQRLYSKYKSCKGGRSGRSPTPRRGVTRLRRVGRSAAGAPRARPPQNLKQRRTLMALKDLLQSQKTIRELKTETAALRLEKAESRPSKGTA